MFEATPLHDTANSAHRRRAQAATRIVVDRVHFGRLQRLSSQQHDHISLLTRHPAPSSLATLSPSLHSLITAGVGILRVCSYQPVISSKKLSMSASRSR